MICPAGSPYNTVAYPAQELLVSTYSLVTELLRYVNLHFHYSFSHAIGYLWCSSPPVNMFVKKNLSYKRWQTALLWGLLTEDGSACLPRYSHQPQILFLTKVCIIEQMEERWCVRCEDLLFKKNSNILKTLYNYLYLQCLFTGPNLSLIFQTQHLPMTTPLRGLATVYRLDLWIYFPIIPYTSDVGLLEQIYKCTIVAQIVHAIVMYYVCNNQR